VWSPKWWKTVSSCLADFFALVFAVYETEAAYWIYWGSNNIGIQKKEECQNFHGFQQTSFNILT
jgi:hypothetical protein